MTVHRLKIIPLLVAVALLAFSLRMVEVFEGASKLSGAAMAEEDKKPALIIEDSEEAKMSGLQEAEPLSNDTGQEPVLPWRASVDEDPAYTEIKMEMFEDLSERRRELEEWENQLQAREALLRATEQELDKKYQELSRLREEIEKLLDQQSEEESARTRSLVKIYEGMKAKDAARIFDTLDLDVLVSVVSGMSERKLAPILAEMNPERARTVTIMLAERNALPTLPQN